MAFQKTVDGKIIHTGLDPQAPYSLGNVTYHAECVCKDCGQLSDEEIYMDSGWYDGYRWTHPRCKKCFQYLPSEIVRN